MKTLHLSLPFVLLLAAPLLAQETTAPAPIVRRAPDPTVSTALLNPVPLTLPLGQAAAQVPATSPSALPPAPLPAPPPCFQPYPCCYPRPRPVPGDFNGPLIGLFVVSILLLALAIHGA